MVTRGTNNNVVGEEHHAATLSAVRVRAIRYLYWVKGINQTCLARLYNVSNGAIHDAVNYITWRHVRDRWQSDQIHAIRRAKA